MYIELCTHRNVCLFLLFYRSLHTTFIHRYCFIVSFFHTDKSVNGKMNFILPNVHTLLQSSQLYGFAYKYMEKSFFVTPIQS
jgi:hypothetical protein